MLSFFWTFPSRDSLSASSMNKQRKQKERPKYLHLIPFLLSKAFLSSLCLKKFMIFFKPQALSRKLCAIYSISVNVQNLRESYKICSVTMYNRASFLLQKIYIETLCKPGAYFSSAELAESIFLHRTAQKGILFSKSETEKKIWRQS